VSSNAQSYNVNRGWVGLDFTLHQLGYRYGINGNLIKFAAAILLLHVAVSIGHIIIVVSCRTWTSCSWAIIGGMMALAMNSQPTEKLRNTCAGIPESTTWKETVKVREVSDGHLELVFDDEKNDDNIYKKSRPGKKYGNFPGETRHCAQHSPKLTETS